MTTTEFIEGSAGKIAVHDLGGAGDRTLVVCHATGFLGQVYRAMARELAASMNVVALDFRGHGDSDTPTSEDGFAWTGMVDDLLRVIDHLDRTNIHGFGHSMGGAALLGAERERPGTFASIFVFEPIVPPGKFEGESAIATAARARMRTFPSYAAALARYASRPPLGLFRADVLYDYVHQGFAESDDGVTLKCTPESEAETFHNAGSIRLDQLADIDTGVTVAKSGDGGLPAQLVEPILGVLPNGTRLDFPAITHFGPLQDPVTVANAVRERVGASSPTP